MTTARSRAAAAWGVTPAVLGHAGPDAGNRPALPDDPAPTPPFGTAWAEFEAVSAADLREALRLDERQRWAEELSGGIVEFPRSVERPFERVVTVTALT